MATNWTVQYVCFTDGIWYNVIREEMEGEFCEGHEDSWLHALEKEYEEIGRAQLKMREKRGEKRNTELCHLLCYFVLTPIHSTFVTLTYRLIFDSFT